MKTIRLCPGCGLPVAPDAPAGICPECLLKSAASADGMPAASAKQDVPRSLPVPIPGECFGDYRIIRLLGHGGMGRVFEAEHASSGRRVALKVIGQALASDDDRKRFLREGRLAAGINHPNVVYIHGSDEVHGVPIIAMELVHGGTLKDRLKHEGPLPVADAVATVIQIIDGLEAAHATGVLHRDIKPANCFVGADGTVKVGDFGLSVSTLSRGESLLTAHGAVLGTPTYASPEQLRGEELDGRSDIYSVGATLFHLLTGQVPFTANDFVKLITEVLDKQPPAPHALRAEIPLELSRVVVRCLAKDPKARYQSYAALREALLPFCRREIEPARPARRFAAGLIDDFLAYGPCLLFFLYWSLDPLDFVDRERTVRAALICLPFYLVYMAYYAVAEGLWGSGLGKTLLGLRVVDRHQQAPGIARALCRVLIYMVPFTLPSLLAMLFVSKQTVLAQIARNDTRVTDWIWFPLTILLFATMRRRNGYAALHDLATGTRVIVRPKMQARPAMQPLAASAAAEPSSPYGRLIGPYEVRQELWKNDREELLLAYDPILRRQIWIHLHSEPLSQASPRRRDLSRPTRLRWLNHGISSGRAWDAYEAPPGRDFLSATERPQPWNAVRFWLADLCAELVAGQNDHSTAATAGLDRLWVTASGRTLLLDFPAPPRIPKGDDASAVSPAPENAWSAQRFLSAVASRALHGSERRRDVGIPLYAQRFLVTLERGAFDTLEFVLGNLHSLLAQPAEITRARRLASVAVVPVITFLVGVWVVGIVMASRFRADRTWMNMFPGEASLRVALDIYEDTEDDPASEHARTARLYIAQHFRNVATNDAVWTNPDLMEIASMRPLFQTAMDAPPAAADEIAMADQRMESRMREKLIAERMVPLRYILKTGLFVYFTSILVAICSIVLFREPPLLRLLGIAVLDGRGERARRPRLLFRSMLQSIGTGVLFVPPAMLVLRTFGDGSSPDTGVAAARVVTILVAATCLAAALGLGAWVVRRTDRAPHDLLARTRLVPR